MAGANVRLEIGELKKLQKQLEVLNNQTQVNQFFNSCAKELAARLLAKVIKRTPVGDYTTEVEVVAKRDSKKHKKGEVYTKKVNKSGKVGGTLRRGWTGGTNSTAKAYADSLNVNKVGATYMIEMTNPVEYASYVEFGHRTRNHKGWVEGQFMLTISEDEIRNSAPRILQQKLDAYLKECFK